MGSSPTPGATSSNRPPLSGPVAQWSERGTHNPLVAGSIPAGPTIDRSSPSFGPSFFVFPGPSRWAHGSPGSPARPARRRLRRPGARRAAAAVVTAGGRGRRFGRPRHELAPTSSRPPTGPPGRSADRSRPGTRGVTRGGRRHAAGHQRLRRGRPRSTARPRGRQGDVARGRPRRARRGPRRPLQLAGRPRRRAARAPQWRGPRIAAPTRGAGLVRAHHGAVTVRTLRDGVPLRHSIAQKSGRRDRRVSAAPGSPTLRPTAQPESWRPCPPRVSPSPARRSRASTTRPAAERAPAGSSLRGAVSLRHPATGSLGPGGEDREAVSNTFRRASGRFHQGAPGRRGPPGRGPGQENLGCGSDRGPRRVDGPPPPPRPERRPTGGLTCSNRFPTRFSAANAQVRPAKRPFRMLAVLPGPW